MTEVDGKARIHGGDEAAEMGLLGALMLPTRNQYDNIDIAARQLVASDFVSIGRAAAFHAIVEMRRMGQVIDPTLLVAELNQAGTIDMVGGLSAITGWMEHAPYVSNVQGYIDIIADLSNRRRVLHAMNGVVDRVYDVSNTEFHDEAVRALKDVEKSGELSPPPDFMTAADFLDMAEEAEDEWLIFNIIRKKWRAMVIGSEGAGKMVLLRQLAMCAAAGVHPFYRSSNFMGAKPVKVAMIDLENSMETINEQIRMNLRGISKWNGDAVGALKRVKILSREAGLDLRTRVGRQTVEACISAHEAELVVIGPLYKASRKKGNESYEEEAMEVAGFLDDIRVRYGVGLLLESHAPKSRETPTPIGSSVWMRWPEMGFAMVPEISRDSEGDAVETGNMKLERFRKPRNNSNWPKGLIRGSLGTSEFPWEAQW